MSIPVPDQLSDRELLDATVRAAGAERHTTVELLTLIAELDARRLYLGEGCSSLFIYCTQVLRLSEHAAYHRIEAARAARGFPAILELLAGGALTLTTVALLRPHLTRQNHQRLLEGASHKTKREVEHQIACLAPQPDAKPLVRKVAVPNPVEAVAPGSIDAVTPSPPDVDERSAPPVRMPMPPRPVLAPLAADRYLLKVTVSGETHAKLRRAQDLLRHTIPTGDPAAILDRALTMLVDHLERRRAAKTRSPRSALEAPPSWRRNSRYVPAAVRRAVWARDQGRCAFEGPHGRCTETGHLEFHHVLPFAAGGPMEPDNLALRCRAHNSYESEQRFGRRVGDPERVSTR